MDRAGKEQTLENLKEKFAKSNAAFLSEYRGMTVEKLGELRKKIRACNGELKIVKNRIAKLALKGSAYEGLTDQFRGPIALALSYKDAAGVAKALSESLSDTSPFKLKVASVGGKTINEANIKALAKLPSKEVLLSMLLGALQAPARNFACTLAALPINFVNVLTDLKNKKEKTS